MESEPIDDATVLLVAREGEGASIRRALTDAGCRVRRVDSDDALEAIDDAAVDCVVTAVGGRGADGAVLELLREAAHRDPAPPVVHCPERVDPAAVSEAVAAGVVRLVPPDARSEERLREAVSDAVAESRRRRRGRERARAFEAIFQDDHTYAAVLEPDGTVRRANDRIRAALDRDADDGAKPVPASDEGDGLAEDGGVDVASAGRSFAALPWWADDDERAAVREAIDRAREGRVEGRELAVEIDGKERILEATVRPVRDEDGGVRSLVVEATDVTERADLEAELRESEELHRVTLNNMTDTVLITDDAGRFTYVCPNVHFIFGYTDEQIHEMGTIDELLGEDLFDRDELDDRGVLTNIECTAADRAGEEHTLLVNVREVSIQDGTILYSCRDVTKRKEREEALATLQRTARRLLYAETREEIANVLVADATDVLGVEASAALVFDTDENVLRPVAVSEEMEALHGPFPAFRANGESLTGRSFVDGETRFFEDVHEADALANPATDVRSGAFVPLGDHGVFVAGSAAVGRFDEVTRELADLLAATAEAALDRVARESTLREQERELQRRNRRLSRLDRINEIIREIDGALVRAETREEIERAVCERLTAEDRYRFAWIGGPDAAGERLEARAWDGHDRGYLDSVSFDLEAGEGADDGVAEPACRAMRSNSIAVVSNVADRLREDPWRREALSREYQSAVAVPLAYDEFTYGVLTVYADRPSAFDDVSRAVFEELGETIASAMGAIERKSALLASSSTRLELAIGDENFVFRRLATRADCTVSFGGVQQATDGASVFATVEGAAVEDVLETANGLTAVEEAQVLTDDGEGGTLRLHLSGPFLALRLADHGIVLRRVEATPDGARVVVDVPSGVDPRRCLDVVENAFADVTLVSKETVEAASARDLRSALLDRLTDRQLEVAQVAYHGGFYGSPRERTGEEIADALGISSAAFYRHNRRIQGALFAALFDDVGLPARAESEE